MRAPARLLCGSLLLAAAALAQDLKAPAAIPAKDAHTRVGETITVEGKVAQVFRSERLVRINLGARYPDCDFSLVIFPPAFTKFPGVENLEGRTVRASGKVVEFRGRAQIILDAPAQLTVLPASTEKAEDSKKTR